MRGGGSVVQALIEKGSGFLPCGSVVMEMKIVEGEGSRGGRIYIGE